MVQPAGQQVNPSPLAGPISLASEHKVLIGSNDFLLSYSPLDWRGLSSGGGIPSPLVLCSIRFQSNPVTCKHFFTSTQSRNCIVHGNSECMHTYTWDKHFKPALWCLQFCSVFFLLLSNTGHDHLLAFVTCKWITTHVMESTGHVHTWAIHPHSFSLTFSLSSRFYYFFCKFFTFVNSLKTF